MKQQIEKTYKVHSRKQKNMLSFTQMINLPKRDNFDNVEIEEDGENIIDEEMGEMQKDLSFIKCKPSLIHSNKQWQDENEKIAAPSQILNTYETQSIQRIAELGQNQFGGTHDQRNNRMFNKTGVNTSFLQVGEKNEYFFNENYLFEQLYAYQQKILDNLDDEE